MFVDDFGKSTDGWALVPDSRSKMGQKREFTNMRDKPDLLWLQD